jgi:AcrR family transcriptional regulator
MTESPVRDTVDVIIDGALRAIARRGTTKLSMTDICEEAGVSRGTLYRYFSNRDEVLDAVNLHLVSVRKDTFDRAVAENPAPEQRIRVMLHAMLSWPTMFPHMRTMVEYEPKLSLTFLTNQMAEELDNLAEYLEPVVPLLPAGRAGIVTAHDLAEFLYRIVTSVFLIPTTDSAVVEEKIAAVCELAIGGGAARPRGKSAAASPRRSSGSDKAGRRRSSSGH